MTRMVEENRRRNWYVKSIRLYKIGDCQKYAIYATLASGIGILLGTVLGTNLLPESSLNCQMSNMILVQPLSFMIGRQLFKQRLLSLLQRLARR